MLFKIMYYVELLLLNVVAIKTKTNLWQWFWIILSGNSVIHVFYTLLIVIFYVSGRLRRTGHFARTYTGGWVVHKKAA